MVVAPSLLDLDTVAFHDATYDPPVDERHDALIDIARPRHYASVLTDVLANDRKMACGVFATEPDIGYLLTRAFRHVAASAAVLDGISGIFYEVA
jgi:hypothetical protein